MGLRDLLSGFTEEINPPDAMPNIYDGAIGTPDDLIDYGTKEMIQASQRVDTGFTDSDGSGTEIEPVRLINQALDFLGEVGTEVDEWIDREMGEGHRVVPAKDYGTPIPESSVGTMSWRPNQFFVDGEKQIARRDPTRRYIRLVNTGPGVVSISAVTRAGGGVQSNTFSLPVSKLDGTGPYSPVELPTVDEVWAVPAVLGVGATVEVSDFFGMPDGT